MNSYIACAIFSGSTSDSAFAVDRAMRSLYCSLLGADTAPGALHNFGELIAVEGVTF